MSSNEVTETLAELVELISECGGSRTIAAWLGSQRAILKDPGIDESVKIEVFRAIRLRIPGMNGIAEMYLRPPASSRYSPEAANAKLGELVSELFQLTQP